MSNSCVDLIQHSDNAAAEKRYQLQHFQFAMTISKRSKHYLTGISPTMKQYLGLRGKQLSRAALLLVVSPAFLCYGYNQAVLGGVLTLDSFVEAFPAMDTVHTEGHQQTKNANIQGTIVALYLVGGIFGALSCTQLGDKIGRRGVILISSAITLVGAILMASSYSLAQFIVARLVLGLGVGGTTATVVSLHYSSPRSLLTTSSQSGMQNCANPRDVELKWSQLASSSEQESPSPSGSTWPHPSLAAPLLGDYH
jgi:hypothetical protein